MWSCEIVISALLYHSIAESLPEASLLLCITLSLFGADVGPKMVV